MRRDALGGFGRVERQSGNLHGIFGQARIRGWASSLGLCESIAVIDMVVHIPKSSTHEFHLGLLIVAWLPPPFPPHSRGKEAVVKST